MGLKIRYDSRVTGNISLLAPESHLYYLSYFKLRESLTSLSGTFKARYKGIYQFSVTLLCGACSNLHFELVRGTPGFGTKVLAVGKAKNSEIHHTHQVTITVFAELSPNDPVKV